MHEVFWVNLQNPSQKLHKNLFDFEKPQILQKSQKLRFQRMKCMKNERIDTYQVKENLKKFKEHLGKRFGVRKSDLGCE